MRELEELFLRDLATVRDVLLDALSHAVEGVVKEHATTWSLAQIESELTGLEQYKPSDQLRRLAHTMGFAYKKTFHGPLIAAKRSTEKIDDVRELLAPWRCPELSGTSGRPITPIF